MESFNKKDVFTVLNAADAEEHLKMKGYFAESLSNLQKNITDGVTDTLEAIEYDNVWCFSTPTDSFPLFLPASKVIKLEKKYRPFKSHRELCDNILKDTLTCIDHGIEIEDKLNCCQYRLMIMGTFNNGVILPLYGALTFEQLFDKFKVNLNGNWRPFGVAEE